jgi:uncharacterized protein UPF0236
VKWFTTFGAVEVIEQLLRLGRRGAELRPFCQKAGVSHRSYSRRLQRVLTDFGAESSFARAAERVKEHYGIEVPIGAVREHTLRHGRAISGVSEQLAPVRPSKQITTQIDGSMVPAMKPGIGKDARKAKSLFWREVRLCSARAEGQSQPVYGATLGSVETAAWVWEQTARQAGCGPKTFVHGVGDGAPWIVEKFNDNFGEQGRYLIDFFHVSEYLAAAAPTVARAGKEEQWLHRQQGRLLNEQVDKVLRSLEKHQELPTAGERPVAEAYRYLQERREHLHYARARNQNLEIGSGEIESGHRHVVQQRLKLAGAWWRETNIEPMLALRVARANGWWNLYWAHARN